jgi:hypothetical protein
MEPIYGIDISQWQGHINWDAVKADPQCRFVYIRAAYGLKKDPLFEENRIGAIYAGIPFGVYGFPEWWSKKISMKTQAEFFWSVIKDNPGNLPIAGDFEKNEAQAESPKLTSLNAAHYLSKYLEYRNWMIGFSRGKFTNYQSGWITLFMRNFSGDFSWCPRYKGLRDSGGYLYQPTVTNWPTTDELANFVKPVFYSTYAKKYSIFQFSSTGLGCNFYLKTNSSKVDLNFFNGNEDDFSIFCGRGCVPTFPVEKEDKPISSVPVLGKKATVICWDGVNVREGIGTSSNIVKQSNGKDWVLPFDKSKYYDVLEIGYDTSGNDWARIGVNQWICICHNGRKLLEIA